MARPNAPPKRAGNSSIDSRLTERLLTDFSEGADTLPLLGFALEKLYHKYGSDGDLTLEDYEAIRGSHETVQAAIFQETIDTALQEPYRPPVIPIGRAEQEQGLRRAFIPFLARINPENNEPMRQVARLAELPADVHPLVERLVDARLLIRDKDAIEVAHESLLRQWPKLRGWLIEDLDNLLLRDSIRRLADEWKKEGQRVDMLVTQGERLTKAEALLATPGYVVAADSDERAYLNACNAVQQAREQEKEERAKAERIAKEHELEQAKALAEAQRQKTRNTRIWLGVALLVLGFAVWQYFKAEFEAQQAKSRQLAAQSPSEMDENPELGLLLAVQAHNVAPTAEASDALLSALERVRGVWGFLPGKYLPDTLALSPDGALMAIGRCLQEGQYLCASSAIDIRRIADLQRIGTVRVEEEARSLAFSGDAHRLAATACCVTQGEKENVHALMFDLTGDPATSDGVKLVKIGDRLFEQGREPSPAAQLADAHAVAASKEALEQVRHAIGASGDKFSGTPATFGPDPRVLVTVTGTDIYAPTQVELWDAVSSPRRLARLELQEPQVGGAAIRADGRLAAAFGCEIMATGRICGAGELAIIDATDEKPRVAKIRYEDQDDWIRSLTVMPTGPLVLSGGCGKWARGNCGSGELRMWRVEDGEEKPLGYEPVRTFGGAVESIALSADGKLMGLTSQRGRASLWRLDGSRESEKGWLASPLEVRFATKDAAAQPALKCGEELIKNPVLTKVSAQLQPPTELCAALESFALDPSPNGEQGVSAELSGSGMLLALSGCAERKRQTADCEGPHTTVWSIGGGHLVKLATVETAGEVTSLAFDPDGNRLVLASCSGLTLVQYCETGKLELVEFTQKGSPKHTIAEGLAGVSAVAFRPGREELAFATCARLDDGGAVRECAFSATHFLGLAPSPGEDVPLYGHRGRITDLAFNPDGTLLASGASDGSVALWDSVNRHRLGPVLPAHALPVEAVRFVSSEAFVSSTESDEIEWHGSVVHWKEAACRIANRNFTRDEWMKYMEDVPYDIICPDLPDPSEVAPAETNPADVKSQALQLPPLAPAESPQSVSATDQATGLSGLPAVKTEPGQTSISSPSSPIETEQAEAPPEADSPVTGKNAGGTESELLKADKASHVVGNQQPEAQKVAPTTVRETPVANPKRVQSAIPKTSAGMKRDQTLKASVRPIRKPSSKPPSTAKEKNKGSGAGDANWSIKK